MRVWMMLLRQVVCERVDAERKEVNVAVLKMGTEMRGATLGNMAGKGSAMGEGTERGFGARIVGFGAKGGEAGGRVIRVVAQRRREIGKGCTTRFFGSGGKAGLRRVGREAGSDCLEGFLRSTEAVHRSGHCTFRIVTG